MGQIVMLPKVKVQFPSIFEAKSYNGGTPYFSAHFIFDKESDANRIARRAIADIAKTAFGPDNYKDRLEVLDDTNKICYHTKGKKNPKDGKFFPGFEGQCWILASNKEAPLVIDRDKTRLTVRDGKIYPGVIVNARVDFWIPKGGTALYASLLGIQFVDEGDRFTEKKPATTDDFDDISEGVSKSGGEDEWKNDESDPLSEEEMKALGF